MDQIIKDHMMRQQEGALVNSQDSLEASGFSATSLELLEQHQAKEQARLLQRFKELREWQQQQQLQLMMQQQQQLTTLQKEQNKVQSLHATKQLTGNRASRPNAARSMSPIMTPPCKPRPGPKADSQEMVGNSMTAGISVDSGLVSMQDTIKSQLSTLPKPVMYIDPSKSHNLPEEDKYTNSDLFSNPGGRDDVDDDIENMMIGYGRNNEVGGPFVNDGMSDTSEFVIPKLPPPRPMRGGVAAQAVGMKTGRDISTAEQLAGLEQLLTTAPAGLLQKMLTLLPKATDSISSDVPPMKSIVENSASPTLTGPSRPSFHGQMHNTQHQKGTNQQYLPHHSHNLQQQHQMPQQQLQDRQINSRIAMQSGANFLPQQPRAFDGQNVTAQDLVQMGLLDASQLQDAQYIPRSFYTNGVDGAQRSPIDEVEEEDVDDNVEDEDEEEYFDEEDEDEEDLEDESQNETAKEVKVDEDDERPIGGTGGAKSFEKLLEEKLREEEEEKDKLKQTQSEADDKPRTFLRKGEGIARFNSAPKKPKKPPPRRQEKRSSGGTGRNGESDNVVKMQNHGSSADKGKSAAELDRQNKEKNSVGDRLKSMASRKVSVKDGKYNSKATKPGVKENNVPSSPPAKLTLIRNAASRKLDQHKSRQTEESSDGNYGMSSMVENGHKSYAPSDPALDQSPSSKSIDDHDSTELDSLAEFELLEDVADNMSFCSNSSLVRKLVCSDAKDHQDAVKKLHAITESRKQRDGKVPPLPPSLAQTTNSRHLLNSKTDKQERVGSNTLQNAISNNTDIVNGNNNNNNAFYDPYQGKSQAVKGNKIDNIIMAKPTDYCSSSDATLTESSSDDEGNDNTAVENSYSQETDRVAELNKNQFSTGYFNDQQQHFGKPLFSSLPSELPQDSLPVNSAMRTLSPNKPITRKVASLTSKVNSANDTLAMLQALSKKAGFLAPETNGNHFPSLSEAKNSGEMQAYNVESAEKDSVNGFQLNKALGDFRMQFNGNVGGQNPKEYNNGNYDDDDRGDGYDMYDNNGDKDQGFLTDKNGTNQMENGRHQEVEGDRYATEGKTHLMANGFDDEAEWSDDDDDAKDDDWDENNPLSRRLNPTTTMTSASNNPPATPPTSKLVTRLFPKLKPPVTKEINPPPHTSDNYVSSQGQNSAVTAPSADGITSRVLREKLMELETEIERFRSENSNLDRLRREREEGLAKLKQQIDTFEREKESELKRLEDFKTEETKKLKRERKLFDSYQKKVRSMPDKREREEIENLKGQLEEAQDELRRKESRWNSTVSRLKNRLAEVELENGELKEEVRILEKKRLEWLTAQSQAKASSSSLLNHGQVDAKPQNQDHFPSSQHRSSTPTRNEKPVDPVSAQRKKTAAISLRTSVPAITTSSSASTKSGRQPKAAPGKAPKAGGTSDSSTIPSTITTSSQPTLRTSGESLPMQNNLVPVMMENTLFAQMGVNGQSVPSSTAMGTLASSSLSPRDNKSAAMQAMEKAVVEKGNPMEFVENVHSDGKVEKLYKNGAKEVTFPNGTIKDIAADGQTIVCRLANGDIRQIFPDHRVVYIFSEAQIMQTTFPDGLETFQFKNGQVERRYPDGTVEITFPSKDVKYIFPDGGQEVRLTDGTVMTYNNQGERTVEYPSGDREVHTAEYQRREFPDGIVKTVYADGRHETRFPNGRIRMRDKSGNVIMDQICYR